MIALTIDGRRIVVEPGTTILQAAQWLGIHIPTMCHVPGIEPAASCFICAVQIEGQRTLSPACAMLVAEGMVVTTANDDVRTDYDAVIVAVSHLPYAAKDEAYFQSITSDNAVLVDIKGLYRGKMKELQYWSL